MTRYHDSLDRELAGSSERCHFVGHETGDILGWTLRVVSEPCRKVLFYVRKHGQQKSLTLRGRIEPVNSPTIAHDDLAISGNSACLAPEVTVRECSQSDHSLLKSPAKCLYAVFAVAPSHYYVAVIGNRFGKTAGFVSGQFSEPDHSVTGRPPKGLIHIYPPALRITDHHEPIAGYGIGYTPESATLQIIPPRVTTARNINAK